MFLRELQTLLTVGVRLGRYWVDFVTSNVSFGLCHTAWQISDTARNVSMQLVNHSIPQASPPAEALHRGIQPLQCSLTDAVLALLNNFGVT